MKLNELLLKGEELLLNAEIENYRNEARWLLEDAFNLKSGQLFLKVNEEADKSLTEFYIERINERASSRPIQYIIGSWDFYGREFSVGEGVLIPRPETELLVDYALDYLKDRENPVVIDLCAGSGCIGLTVAAERPDAKVILVEKFPEAFSYLSKNREAVAPDNTELVKGDVLIPDELNLPEADLILSNPPYIPADEIESLQREVHFEPVTALDGGNDGLDFYREIFKLYKRIGKGPVAFECGEGQADDIIKIFGNGRKIKDFNSIDRAVVIEGENNAF